MRAIFVPYAPDETWREKYFPHRSGYALPVAGKFVADHLLDLAWKLKISATRILDNFYDPALARHLALRKNNFTPLEYHGVKPFAQLPDLLAHHAGFLAAEPSLIIYGMVWPEIHSPEEFMTGFVPTDNLASAGIYYCAAGQFYKYQLPVLHLNSLRSYFDINFSFLHGNFYDTPGYADDNGVLKGMNVRVPRHCQLTPPLLLNDYCLLLGPCQLEADTIVGRGVIIDAGAHIEHSVIFDQTYISSNLALQGKIVTPERIIDPYTGGIIERRQLSGLCWTPRRLRELGLRLNEIVWCLALLVLFVIRLGSVGQLHRPGRFHNRAWRRVARYCALFQVLRGSRVLVRGRGCSGKALFNMASGFTRRPRLGEKLFFDKVFDRNRSWRLTGQVIRNNILMLWNHHESIHHAG